MKSDKNYSHGITSAQKNGWHISRYGDDDFLSIIPTTCLRTHHTSLWLKIREENYRVIASMFLALPEQGINLEAVQIIKGKKWCAGAFYQEAKKKIFDRINIRLKDGV